MLKYICCRFWNFAHENFKNSTHTHAHTYIYKHELLFNLSYRLTWCFKHVFVEKKEQIFSVKNCLSMHFKNYRRISALDNFHIKCIIIYNIVVRLTSNNENEFLGNHRWQKVWRICCVNLKEASLLIPYSSILIHCFDEQENICDRYAGKLSCSLICFDNRRMKQPTKSNNP